MPPPTAKPAAASKTAQASGDIRHLRTAAALTAHLASGALWPVYLVTSAEIEERGRNDDRPGADP